MSLGGQSRDAISGDYGDTSGGSSLGGVGDSNVDSFGSEREGIVSIDRNTGDITYDGFRGGAEVAGGVVTNLNTYQALADAARREAAREATREAARHASALAHQRSLELDRQAQALADEAAVANAAAANRRSVQSIFPGLGFLGNFVGPSVFRDDRGRVNLPGTIMSNVPGVGTFMNVADYIGNRNWSTESPFGPEDAEQSSWDAMNPYSFPGDLPGGGFDRTAGEGGDPYSNIPPVAPPAPEPEVAYVPPAPETPTYDPSLFYRPTLLDQSPSLPNFAALNDAFTRSYALRPGIYTAQPNLLGYTQYG